MEFLKAPHSQATSIITLPSRICRPPPPKSDVDPSRPWRSNVSNLNRNFPGSAALKPSINTKTLNRSHCHSTRESKASSLTTTNATRLLHSSDDTSANRNYNAPQRTLQSQDALCSRFRENQSRLKQLFTNACAPPVYRRPQPQPTS